MMKKMWKMRKDKSAVSPVIATILMVAITVVLAAVLYVMVMGFGGSTNSTPTGSFTSVATGTTTAKVNIGVISPKTTYANCKITLIDNTAATAVSVSGAMSARTTTAVTINGFNAGSYTTASTATNLGGDGDINSGDYITLTYGAVNVGLLAGHSYTMTLLYVPTGGSICSTTFTA